MRLLTLRFYDQIQLRLQECEILIQGVTALRRRPQLIRAPHGSVGCSIGQRSSHNESSMFSLVIFRFCSEPHQLILVGFILSNKGMTLTSSFLNNPHHSVGTGNHLCNYMGQ